RPAGAREMGEAERTGHDPTGPSARSSARHRAEGSDDTSSPRSVRIPPASERAKTSASRPLPAHRNRARRPPGYWTTASWADVTKGAGTRGRALADAPL